MASKARSLVKSANKRFIATTHNFILFNGASFTMCFNVPFVYSLVKEKISEIA